MCGVVDLVKSFTRFRIKNYVEKRIVIQEILSLSITHRHQSLADSGAGSVQICSGSGSIAASTTSVTSAPS